MLVKEWMTENVVTVGVHDTMQRAIDLMKDFDVTVLPVVDGGKLVGIVTDRDLKRASPSDTAMLESRQILYHLSRVEVGAIMSRNPVVVPFDYTIEETAEVLLNHRFSGCPVVDHDGTMMGIVTKDDLFSAIISVSGLSKRGIQFGFLLDDRAGSIREVTDVIRQHGGRLAGIMTSYEKCTPGYRNVYVRAFNLSRDQAIQLKTELQSVAKMVYMVDHMTNKREIFETGTP